ncbi:hypothetical protein, partial [Salmonella sp. s51228]|uniref:hypothetical protein n=1 Tax=Salmonella sp. s51228 TaxID=3159652 RepID=UPI00397F0E59
MQEIAMENLYFLRNRDLYTTEYFHFIYQLDSVNMKESEGSEAEGFARVCMHLSINFLFNTYFRIRKKLRSDRDHWVQNINSMVTRNKHACLGLISFLGKSDAKQYIKPYLLECPSKEVRSAFALILSNLLENS